METLANIAIKQLPNLISVINSFTGNHIPPNLVESVQKLVQYGHDTVENLKQNTPLTPEQDAELDNLIEQLPARDYWQSKDTTSTTTNPPTA